MQDHEPPTAEPIETDTLTQLSEDDLSDVAGGDWEAPMA